MKEKAREKGAYVNVLHINKKTNSGRVGGEVGNGEAIRGEACTRIKHYAAVEDILWHKVCTIPIIKRVAAGGDVYNSKSATGRNRDASGEKVADWK